MVESSPPQSETIDLEREKQIAELNAAIRYMPDILDPVIAACLNNQQPTATVKSNHTSFVSYPGI